jgi:hypothetical protein
LNYTADAHPTEWDVLQRRWGLYSAEFDGTFSADAIARFAMRYGRNGLRRRRATELARQMQRRARALRNFALVLQHVHRDLERAEKYFMKSLEEDPEDESTKANFLRLMKEGREFGVVGN